MKTFLIILTVIVCVIIGFYFISDSMFGEIGKSTFRQTTLVSKNGKSKLFLKSENWGLTDDNQTTVISTESNKRFKADSTKEFVFNGLEPFLYQVNNDTLFLYLRRKIITPEKFESRWTIIQKEIENPEFMHKIVDPNFHRM